QALDRLDPVLPLSPGRAERHGFEYYRHGTLSLYAALNTATGRVHGKTAARHTSREFVDFLQEVLSLCPLGNKFTSSWTISPPTKRRRSGSSSNNIRESSFTSRPLTHHGSTRSRSGSPRSNARSSRVAP